MKAVVCQNKVRWQAVKTANIRARKARATDGWWWMLKFGYLESLPSVVIPDSRLQDTMHIVTVARCAVRGARCAVRGARQVSAHRVSGILVSLVAQRRHVCVERQAKRVSN